ncbi:hypothetical protein BST45_02605 [Mycobacterium shinjukuense]|nr:hypothetical protein BST45_02605 [Mycobacterium shinjukuense]
MQPTKILNVWGLAGWLVGVLLIAAFALLATGCQLVATPVPNPGCSGELAPVSALTAAIVTPAPITG